MLSLPYMIVLVGWAMGYIILMVGAIGGCWSNLLIAEMSEKYRLPNYEAICLKVGGKFLQKVM